MNLLRLVMVLVSLGFFACDDTPPAQDPSTGAASASATTPHSHSPSHGQFNGP